jgi:hypothetical protein
VRLLPIGHGGEGKKGTNSMFCSSGVWRGGDSGAASYGSKISAVWSPSTTMVEGQMLQFFGSSPSGALHLWPSGIRLLKIMVVGQQYLPWSRVYSRKVFNLEAFVPIWRPSSSKVVCYRPSTPSGHVLSGG